MILLTSGVLLLLWLLFFLFLFSFFKICLIEQRWASVRAMATANIPTEFEDHYTYTKVKTARTRSNTKPIYEIFRTCRTVRVHPCPQTPPPYPGAGTSCGTTPRSPLIYTRCPRVRHLSTATAARSANLCSIPFYEIRSPGVSGIPRFDSVACDYIMDLRGS